MAWDTADCAAQPGVPFLIRRYRELRDHYTSGHGIGLGAQGQLGAPNNPLRKWQLYLTRAIITAPDEVANRLFRRWRDLRVPSEEAACRALWDHLEQMGRPVWATDGDVCTIAEFAPYSTDERRWFAQRRVDPDGGNPPAPGVDAIQAAGEVMGANQSDVGHTSHIATLILGAHVLDANHA